MRQVTITTARRLAIQKQRLAGALPKPTADGLMEVVGDLGCLQLDPISVVERTHYLVLWSRLGAYSREDLDALVYGERKLFEYWAHCASLVLTEEYPVYAAHMHRYATATSGWLQEINKWMTENDELRTTILSELEKRGPLGSKEFTDIAREGWSSTGWWGGRNVSRMLDFLWLRGVIMVAGRRGIQKLWDLSERVLPEWAPREEWSGHEVVRYASQRSLRALGVATPAHIKEHYIRHRYDDLPKVLKELEREGQIVSVQVVDDTESALPGPWYVHAEDLPLLDRIEQGEWEGRTTLLSPFDNLICDRKRTERLFGFRFRIEIYTPAAKREYGYYVLPILHNGRLIGRIDPRMDRKAGRLHVNAVHAEPDAPHDSETGQAVARAVEELAAFLGARDVEYTEHVPEGWRSALA